MSINITTSQDGITVKFDGPLNFSINEAFETTIEQLKERLAKTVAYLKTLDTKAVDAAAEREITFPLGSTVKGQMTGADYLNHFVLPNFYFHRTAAFACVRAFGADIGKRDFLGAIPIKGI